MNSTASPRSDSISVRPIATRATFSIRNSVGVTRAANSKPPIMLTGPHSAGLGMRFYTGKMFPAKYKNAIFLARHGSWNRTTKFGGDVIAIFLNKDGTVKSSEPFITGFLDNNNYIGRPVDVEFMADGSMLLSDDWNGAIYRITYGKAARVAGR